VGGKKLSAKLGQKKALTGASPRGDQKKKGGGTYRYKEPSKEMLEGQEIIEKRSNDHQPKNQKTGPVWGAKVWGKKERVCPGKRILNARYGGGGKKNGLVNSSPTKKRKKLVNQKK